MIYLYMLMVQAWDLDKDTHSLFRQYLDVAIKRRKALQGFKEIVMDPSVRMYLSKKGNSGARAAYYNTCIGFGRGGWWIESGERSMFNELRVSLPNRVLGGGIDAREVYATTFPQLSTPVLIEEVHPPIISREVYEELGGKGDVGFWWGPPAARHKYEPAE